MVQSHNSGTTKITILVVDDSTTMRSMVQSFLSQDEFHVQVAKSGQEGLARIQEHCPDILLLDFIMPGMNGYEVYTRLREQPEYADLPVVIMSGSKVEVFNKFAESKVEQKFVFLPKPFNPETLKKQIALALELQLISKTVEESVVSEEVPLKPQALSDETTSTKEAPVALQDEPKLQEEVQEETVVSQETVPPNEVIVLDEAVQSTPNVQSAEIPVVQIPIDAERLEPIQQEELAEKTLVAQTSEETAEIAEPQVSTEDMSLSYIHQNLAHILKTETYVMSALRNLDERSAEDMRSIKSLADQTTLLQQEFMYVRGVLNNLNELPNQLETLKEQVLSQPKISQPVEAEQEHLLMVGDRLKNVDSTLMQSVVTLDRLEDIQAGLGETINNSHGKLSDRLTAIERRFEAIIVRPPDPDPLPPPVVSSKRSRHPLLFIAIALGALNLGAIVALLMR